jgi:hypothetical protein
MMKSFIKKCFNSLGYSLIRSSRELDLVGQIEQLYRETVFKDFPEYDPERIRIMSRLLGTGVGEAAYICYYLRRSLKVEGDVCEFGVAQGRTSALLGWEAIKTDKKIWLFDSFKGLPKPSEKDKLKDDIFHLGAIEKYEGKMCCGIGMVKRELKGISFPEDRTMIVPGFIEETIKLSYLPTKVCFAYIDFDFYDPIAVALGFLDKTLQKGGFVIVDDYDFFSTGVKIAVDEFLLSHAGRYVFSLPLGGAGKFCIVERTT